ncbi:MAG: sulfotransferase family 2 domain-containing protein [Methylocystaceae bacterium]|nr:sulfotransferase family 2 domain-containing protein [Methylocystaceae bacterium]
MLKNNLYFVHIPKTAGTATSDVLIPLLGDRFKSLGHCICSGVIYPWVKRAYIEKFDPETVNDGLIFTIVRNPYDLLVSLYTYGIPYTAPKHREIFNCINFPFHSFRDFIAKLCATEGFPWYAPLQQESLYFQLFGKDGKVVPHVAVKQELLLEGLQKLGKEHFDIEITEVPNVRKTREKEKVSYQDYYDEEIKEMVRKKFEGDLQAFGYGFGSHDNQALIECSDIQYSWEEKKYYSDLPDKVPDQIGALTGQYADIDIHADQFLEDVTLGYSALDLSKIVINRIIKKIFYTKMRLL